MRLLLDALDADRERFPDLKRAYAFDHQGEDPQDTAASWKAKGVEPLLYEGRDGADHDQLYATLGKWARYKQDCLSFAVRTFKEVLGKEASAVTDLERQQVIFLLPRHGGDTTLAEINPSLSWLRVFHEAGLIGLEGSSIRPDRWIARRLDDREAIVAYVDRLRPDADLALLIERALGDKKRGLSKTYETAWRLIIAAGKDAPSRTSLDWFVIEERLKGGDQGPSVRRAITESLRPRLRLSKPWRSSFNVEDGEGSEPERLHDLLRAEMTANDWPTASEILAAWPEDVSATNG